jgi:hypothetical protein
LSLRTSPATPIATDTTLRESARFNEKELWPEEVLKAAILPFYGLLDEQQRRLKAFGVPNSSRVGTP